MRDKEDYRRKKQIIILGKLKDINRREGDEGTTEEQGFLLWQEVDNLEMSN